MKYNVRTNHQNMSNYVSVKTDNVEAAINYAIERTQANGYLYPLLVETEDHDEICIVFNGCCYQIEDKDRIIDNERSEQ